MATTIAVHSFRRGTGKSHIAANIAALLALEGHRVAVVDTNLHSPGIEMLFNLRDEEVGHWLNDYLSGECEIEQAVYDVSEKLGHPIEGRIYLVPASSRARHVARALRHGYDLSELGSAVRQLARSLQLDAVVIDTAAGVHDETLNVLAAVDAVGIVLRLDHQDYQGTSVIVRLAQRLEIPRTLLVVNNTLPGFDTEVVRAEVEQTYGCQVAALLPSTDEMRMLESKSIFVLRYPDHPLTAELRLVASQLAGPGTLAQR
jgi:MinD-like ATPase involved in chromosome partitioning or flagellar assembly